ncbi:MAG: rRNA maturation RNase YbeY [Caldisericaceae bacterium]
MNKRALTIQIRNATRKFKVNKKALTYNISNIVSRLKIDYDLTLDVSFVGKKKISEMNAKFRQKNRPTNVLSFSDRIANNPKKRIGEILLCPLVAENEATRDGNGFNDYVGFLLIHGILHIVGFDHQTDKERKQMEELEESIFRSFEMRQFIRKWS